MSLLDWNSIENSRHGIAVSKKVPYKFNPLRWNRFDCSPLANCPSNQAIEEKVLSGTIPHLEFSMEFQSNKLIYQGNPYTKYQQFLYKLIKSLHDKGYGYRRISYKLNDWELKPQEERNGSTLLLVLFLKGNTKEI